MLPVCTMKLLVNRGISCLIPFLLVLLWIATGVAKTGRCLYTNIGRQMAADCRDLKLREVPGNLRTDIMALVLTENRIRKLTSLDRYSDLELLYLDDNSIERLDVEALAALTGLRALSVRLNSLKVVSPTLLTRLPSLRRLDLSENPSLDAASLMSALAAWAENGGGGLQELSVENCELRTLPIPSPVPQPWLQVLNVSGNPLTGPVVPRLAPLCGLRRLALHGVSQKAVEFCECAQLRRWAAEGLQVEPPEVLKCRGRKGEKEARAALVAEGGDGGTLEAVEAYCLNSNASVIAEALRLDCLQSVKAAEQRSATLRLWAWVGGSIGVVVVLVLLVCCCCCLRRRQRRRRLEAAARRCSTMKPPLVSNKDFDEDFPMKTVKK